MRAKVLIISAVFSLGFVAAGVSAQESTAASDLQKRVQQRKDKIKENLSAAQETRLKERCSNAQAKIKKAEESAKKHSNNQDKKITALIEKLSTFAQNQKEKGQDTAGLETVIAGISQKNQAVDSAYNNYISALEDASMVDCKTDPAGFKASLSDARTQFEALKTARKELRQAIKDQLRPAIKEFRLEKRT